MENEKDQWKKVTLLSREKSQAGCHYMLRVSDTYNIIGEFSLFICVASPSM